VKLSVIIVNYNVTVLLDNCLASVLHYTDDKTTEIIVRDNHSTDDSWKKLIDKYPTVKFQASDKNEGFAIANNKAVDAASGEYILLLNPDTLFIEPPFPELLDFADSTTDLGCLGVRFIDGNGNFLPETKRSVPDVWNSFQKLFLFSSKKRSAKGYYRSDIAEHENAEVEVITGAFMLMKRELYLKAGGLDERYFMYGEDIDLCYTLLQMGCRNYYYGRKTIVHYKGESTVKDRKYLERFYGAMQIFVKKYYGDRPLQCALLTAGLKARHRIALLQLMQKKTA